MDADTAADGSDLQVALAAAEAGAAVLGSMYGTELEHTAKSATDLATAADVAAERAILGVLRSARPQDGFLGEELGEAGSGDGERRWLVDPLCGTVNFAARTSMFCVNVALRVAGSTTVAAVIHPPSGETYWADGDIFGVLGRQQPLVETRTRTVDINADGALDRPFVGAQLAADPAFRAQLSPRVESTSLALAWVAAGQRLGYVTDGQHRDSVHFAAGVALCRAAGCTITDFDGGPVFDGPGIVATADPATHRILLDLIRSHR